MDAKIITQTVRFEIVKPLDGSWDNLGALLRALRAPLHRVLNGMVTELEVAERLCQERGEKPVHPQTLAYRLARDLWRRERELAAERVAKKKIYPGDERIAETSPGSSLVLGLAGAGYARWQKWRKDKWKGDSSLPSFTAPSPIYLTKHGVRFFAKDGSIVLSLALRDGRGTPRVEIIISPYGPSGHAMARKMLDAPTKIGDVRLVQEEHDGKRKWQALMAFTHEVEAPKGDGTMALHRGMNTFLTAAVARAGSREAYTTILETGADVLRHKAIYRARRRSLGQQSRQLGPGARGHGEDRRREHVTRFEDAEARWVRSKCQEVAAHAIGLAKRRGVGKILIERWTNPAKDGAPELGEHVEYLVRSFPFAELRAMIEWAAKRAGIAVEVVDTDHNSQDCPGCGHRHEQAQSGTFQCASCRLERSVDVIFAWNMLLRFGAPNPVGDARRSVKRSGGRIKAALKKGRTAP